MWVLATRNPRISCGYSCVTISYTLKKFPVDYRGVYPQVSFPAVSKIYRKPLPWEPESLVNSAGNGVLAEIFPTSTNNSAEKSRVFSSVDRVEP